MTKFDRTELRTARARSLRRNATEPKQRLWFHLRGAQMHDFSFRRQHPVGPYVLDFYCATANLAVELDGEQHGAEPARRHDAARSKYLASRAIRVLRSWNHELRENCDGVLDAIARELTPDLPLSGGGIPTSVR